MTNILRRLAGVFFVVFLISGCATARLGTGPEAYALKEYPKGSRVAVAKVMDARGSDSAGMIGGCGVKVKAKEGCIPLHTVQIRGLYDESIGRRRATLWTMQNKL